MMVVRSFLVQFVSLFFSVLVSMSFSVFPSSPVMRPLKFSIIFRIAHRASTRKAAVKPICWALCVRLRAADLLHGWAGCRSKAVKASFLSLNP